MSINLFSSISAPAGYDQSGYRCRFADGGSLLVRGTSLRTYAAFVSTCSLSGRFVNVPELEGRKTQEKTILWREHVAAAIRAGANVEWAQEEAEAVR